MSVLNMRGQLEPHLYEPDPQTDSSGTGVIMRTVMMKGHTLSFKYNNFSSYPLRTHCICEDMVVDVGVLALNRLIANFNL